MRYGSSLLLLGLAGLPGGGCVRGGFNEAREASVSPPLGTYVLIHGGTFLMGSPADEPCREAFGAPSNESQHQVTLTHDFELSAFEATAAEFSSLMSYDPSQPSGCQGHCPVDGVSWHQAAAYCNALSREAGLTECYSCAGESSTVSCAEATGNTGAGFYACPGYRLPTDAEWEYAYRAGTSTAYYSGTNTASGCLECATLRENPDSIGWYCANAGGIKHAVGQKQPNAWGIYDLAGNVWEWVNDWSQSDLGVGAVIDPAGPASGARRLVRGGSWHEAPVYLRAAKRDSDLPTVTTDEDGGSLGLRCVRSIHE
jgi:formylglycine-generating enzyme required for sulfatase activity